MSAPCRRGARDGRWAPLTTALAPADVVLIDDLALPPALSGATDRGADPRPRGSAPRVDAGPAFRPSVGERVKRGPVDL